MKSLEAVILDILDTRQPENVKELVKLVQEQTDAKLEDIKKEVESLHQKGLVSLDEPTHHKTGFIEFLKLKQSLWFWIAIGTSFLSFISILAIPAADTPLSYIRYIFSFVLVAFLPGYCLTETLFPKTESLDIIERVTFSIGLSFAATAIVGLFLSFTPPKLSLNTALPTLGSAVIVLAVIALIRKYRAQ